MNRAVRTTTPLRVTSLTSITPRRLTTSTRRPARVAATSYVFVLPPPASMTISTRSPFTAAARMPGGPHYGRCGTYLSSAPRASPANLRHGVDPASLPAALQALKERARGPAGVAVLDGERHAEAFGQVRLGKYALQSPCREHRAAPHEHRVGETGRHLFDVVGHHQHGGR